VENSSDPLRLDFNHEMAVVIAGARAVPVATRSDYQLDLDALERAVTPGTRAIVTVSPNNPTGAVYPEKDLRAVNALCRARGIFHVHDEACEYFLYDDARHSSPGSIDGAAEHTISLYSLSKAYGMASWRLGYMVIPERLWEPINKIQDTMPICPPAVSPAPTGALYLFLRARTSLDAMTVTERLIRRHRVAVVPGSAFGALSGCYLRVSFGAVDEPVMTDGLARLVLGLRTMAES
jgi:aspartate/methionine/tyrosine aminotransferase